jgi:nucleotidyltransferase substrate binding protein (TIGR01987 family)
MTTPDIRWTQRLVNFRRAIATLQRAIGLAQSRPLSELEELGLIQAFEFTHELSWLLLKVFFVDQGVAGISGSRDAVREAVVRQLLPQGDETVWMAMIRSRNLTSHTYNPAVAIEIADLFSEKTFDPSSGGWSYQVQTSYGLPEFGG